MIPIVAFDQIYTFSKDALIEAIPRPDTIPAGRFGPRPGNCLIRSYK